MTSTFHELGVSKQNPNVLVFYFTYTVHGAGFRISVYDKFVNGDPPDSVFNIPTVCPTSGLEDNKTDHMPLRPKLAESFTAEVKDMILASIVLMLLF